MGMLAARGFSPDVIPCPPGLSTGCKPDAHLPGSVSYTPAWVTSVQRRGLPEALAIGTPTPSNASCSWIPALFGVDAPERAQVLGDAEAHACDLGRPMVWRTRGIPKWNWIERLTDYHRILVNLDTTRLRPIGGQRSMGKILTRARTSCAW